MDSENEAKTSDKRRKNLKKGAADGKPFTTENQPSSEAKKEGWKKVRAQRILTQKIIETLTKGKNLDSYVESLLKNAKLGNSKAIETINKGLEEDVIKIAQTDGEGNDYDWSRYSDEELRIMAALQSKGRTGEA